MSTGWTHCLEVLVTTYMFKKDPSLATDLKTQMKVVLANCATGDSVVVAVMGHGVTKLRIADRGTCGTYIFSVKKKK